MTSLKKQKGFTLLELMVIVAIIAILSSLAVTGMSGLVPKMRLRSAANDVQGNLQKTKLEAVRRNVPCLMEFNNTSPGSYRACVDVNINYTCDAGEEVFIRQDFNDYPGVSLQGANFTNGAKVRFNSRGQPRSNGGGFASGSVNCTGKNADSRTVILSLTGRVRIQ